MPADKKPILPDDLVDQLMSGRDSSPVFDKNGLLEHFLSLWNHLEFPLAAVCDSRFGLVKEASLDGSRAF